MDEILRKSNSFMSYQLLTSKFCYKKLSLNEKLIKYLSGSSKEQFDLLYECVRPYFHSVPYVNKVPVMMAFTSDKCLSTIQKDCNSWVVFLATFFNQIDPKTVKEFLIKIYQNYIGKLDMKKLIWSLMQ